MTTIDWENYEDEYEYLYDVQPRNKKLPKMKQGRDESNKHKKEKRIPKREMLDDFLDDEDAAEFGQALMQEFKSKPADKKPKVADSGDKKSDQPSVPNKPFTPKGNNVHTIKGAQIDFDGVRSIEKVQNTHNNKETYGIKFNFKSKNNTFRVVWFNQNVRERDSVYNSEFAFWNSINTK